MLKRRVAAVVLTSILAIQSAAPVWAAGERRVPDGTRIPVRLMEQLSSATLKDQDPVNFAVLEDVVVDGEVVIRQGTPVRGVVVEAQAKRRMGRAGRMFYTVNETRTVDNTTIRLRAVQEKRGQSHVTATTVTTASVAVFVPVAAPFFLLRKGKDVVVPEGTRVDAFVDGDHAIAAALPGTAHAERRPIPSASAAAMTNADVMALHKAGFGEDVMLAKITASRTAFAVDAADLVALKKAGVPERVIAAMVTVKN